MKIQNSEFIGLHIVADDFGLSSAINRGIIRAFEGGILTSAALLVRAPGTQEAIQYAKRNPQLELGIHLALVESWSARDDVSSLYDAQSYFSDGNGRCLHRDWRHFIRKYLRSQISMDQLQSEFRAQCQIFLDHAGGPPAFLNSTQHLHLLPGIQDLVLEVAKEFQIPVVRSLSFQVDLPGFGKHRWLQSRGLAALSRGFDRKAKRMGIQVPSAILGFKDSGHMNSKLILQALDMAASLKSHGGWIEIMVHPGENDQSLRKDLPWAYTDFDWESELSALIDPAVISRVSG